MSLRVRGVGELRGDEAVFNLCGEFLSLGYCALHALSAFGEYELGAVSLHKLSALDGHRFGHCDNNSVASCGCDGGKTDTGVTRGRLDNYGAFLKLSRSLGIVYHRLGDSVLN